MQNFNKSDEVKQQYETSANLDVRILIHKLFSSNKQGWTNWVFSQYKLQENQKILELGCGNGSIWKEHFQEVPPGIRLTLSDFSSGMLEAARTNTSELGLIDYNIIDAQQIPYPDSSFDAVIANHMLYHIPDVDRALSEIRRILKPEGVLYATTMGNSNFKELIDLLQSFDSRIKYPQGAMTESFGLETGELKLSNYFSSVNVRRYIDKLHITDPKYLIDYVLSMKNIGNITDIISADNEDRFRNYVNEKFAEKGYIDIQKDSGIIIATGIK